MVKVQSTVFPKNDFLKLLPCDSLNTATYAGYLLPT